MTMPLNPDLGFLLEAASEGDNRAAETFVTYTQVSVRRLCQALGSGHDIDDLVQETYLRAFRAVPTRSTDGNVTAWLLTIGRRACADAVRERQRHRRIQDRAIALFPRDRTPDRTHVSVLLDEIDDQRREAFVLTQLAGLSYEEAAEICGCPVGTIRSRIARARRDLIDAEHASARDAG
jgi:RNA polymerase sigma-70 factor, ECF subfamily